MRFGTMSRLLVLTLFAAAPALAAHADTVFTFTPNSGPLGYTFSLSDNGTYYSDPGVASLYVGSFPLTFTEPGLSFNDFTAVVGFYNTSVPADTPVIGAPAYDMVLEDVDTSTYFFYLGPQLYSGSEAAPIFTNGSYDLIGYSGQPDGTLTITTTTPEPSSIALLGTGLLSAIAVGRKRFRL